MWFASRRTLIVRGLVTVALGLALMVSPTISLDLLILLFGTFAIVDGALILTTAAVAPRDTPGRTITWLAGILAILVGIVTFLWPGLTQLALLILIAVRAIVIGTIELVTATYIGRFVSNGIPVTVLFASIGLLSIAFGALLLAHPATGLLMLLRVVGVYATAVGLLSIGRAWLFALWSNAAVTVRR
ncbi:MAG: HdeD family acid-resistance protein [Vicinamibacterales bacterium]